MRFLISFFTFSLTFFSLNASYSESISEPWGNDCELAYIKKDKTQLEKSKKHIGQTVCASMIEFFQVYISPIDGPRSSFYPTSSQYALDAIQKYGVFCGISLGCDRLMRENGEAWIYKRTRNYGIERKVDPVR